MTGVEAEHPGDTRADWPRASQLYAPVRERLRLVLDRHPLTARVAAPSFEKPGKILGEGTMAFSPLVVMGSCFSAGGVWQQAVWPAAALELLMGSADLLDDIADGELDAYDVSPGVVLTAAAGLLALAGEAMARSTEDGVAPEIAAELAARLGADFALAAEGQATSLHTPPGEGDVMGAYQLAAGKSGPFGALAAWSGARVTTADADLLERYGEYGRALAVHSQLLNDARDASPEGSVAKEDIRAASPTVPVIFARSRGAPAGISSEELPAWEQAERQRIKAAGGVATAFAMAEAERAQAMVILDELRTAGLRVYGLRALLH
jgi:geranylgeranyl pyrophosphate synthase